jgi:hypothetical protein
MKRVLGVLVSGMGIQQIHVQGGTGKNHERLEFLGSKMGTSISVSPTTMNSTIMPHHSRLTAAHRTGKSVLGLHPRPDISYGSNMRKASDTRS